MKIICDNCRTKYSIADEKVKGKVFKIRCKKCSNIIVVRGNQAQGGQTAPQSGGSEFAGVGDSKEAPSWHLVINQQQVGPMTSTEVKERFSKGEIDAESYIWREGFTDWMRIHQVDEFAGFVQEAGGSSQMPPMGSGPDASSAGGGQPSWGAEAPAQDEAAASSPQAASWGGASSPMAWDEAKQPAWSNPAANVGQSEGGNLFGGSGAEGGRDLFASHPGNDMAEQGAMGQSVPAGNADQGALGNVGNLFHAPTDGSQQGEDLFKSTDEGQQVFPQEGSPSQLQQQMTGARNENSVLFSLNNLQALAMGKSSSPSGPAAAVPGDGSGLIDIKTMATGTQPVVSNPGNDDALANFAAFSAPVAAAPVLMPYASEKPKWLLPAIIGGGALLVIAVVVLVILMTSKKPEPVAVANVGTSLQTPESSGSVGATQPGSAQTAGTQTAGATEPKGTTESTGEASKGTTKDEAKEDDSGDRPKRGRHRSSSRRRSRRQHASESRSSSTAHSSAPAAKPAEKSHRKRDALDDLIDGAVGATKHKSGGSRSKASSSSASNSNLPSQLGREEIQRGMKGIKGIVQGCYDRYKVPGLANVQVKIGRNGRVKSAIVKGMFAGTPTGACVQNAARSARFSAFKGNDMTITYPFILR